MASETDEGTPRGWQGLWRRHEFSLFLSILAVACLTAIFDSQHNYWSNPRASAIDLIRQWSMLGLFSLGAAVVIIAGGIDLSTGSVIAFSGTLCAVILLWLAPEAMTGSQPLPVWAMAVAIAGTLMSGFLVGSLHAWLITRVGLPPFVATLATLVGLRSLARAICEATTLSLLGGASTQIGLFDRNFRYLATSVWIPAVLLVFLGLIFWLMMSRTIAGRHLYALGGNERAALLSGIRTDRLKWLAYCLSAILSSLAGILYICEQSVADPQTLGRGYELNAIAAAVVGGCSLQGGIGSIPGTLLGALFLRTVIDGVSKIIKTGADVYEGLIVGVVVVFAVVFTGREPASVSQRRLFSGALGLVTIANLTCMAGVIAALMGTRLLGGTVQMSSAWLAGWAMLAVGSLLFLCRAELPPALWRRGGVVWGIAVLVLGVSLDQVYPVVQTRQALAAVRQAGGKVMRNDLGIVVDFGGVTTLNDEVWQRIMPSLTPLQPIAELRLQGTAVSDRTLESLVNWVDLARLDVTDTQVSAEGLQRITRYHSKLQVVSGQSTQP